MSAYTKQAIKNSFLKLLNDRPLNQVTVKAIVEDCGINRNTFYYHFTDIPSLATEIITERADQIIRQYANPDNTDRLPDRFGGDGGCSATLRSSLFIYESLNR